VLRATEGRNSVTAIATETHLTVSEVRAALGRLEAEGWLLRRELGGWQRALTPTDGAYPGQP
jgi:DNA-binding GntR family transcriptional regulator